MYTIFDPVVSEAADPRTRFCTTDRTGTSTADAENTRITLLCYFHDNYCHYTETPLQPYQTRPCTPIAAVVIDVTGVRGCATPRRRHGAVINISLARQSLNPNNIICATPSSRTGCGRAVCIRIAKTRVYRCTAHDIQ